MCSRPRAFVFCIAVLASSCWGQIRVMPIGDSITHGIVNEPSHPYGLSPSYRLALWKILRDKGYSVDFVGPWYGSFDGPISYPGYTDQQHAGFAGKHADFFTEGNRSVGLGRDYRPDIALIHLGTNDIGINGPGAVSQTIAEIGQVIDQLRVHRPNITIFLAKIIPSRATFGYYNQVHRLNPSIPGLAASKNRRTRR